jgi:hypothetical protein
MPKFYFVSCLISIGSLPQDVSICVASPRNFPTVTDGSVCSLLRTRVASYAWYADRTQLEITFSNYVLNFEPKVLSETLKAKTSQDVEVFFYWRQFCKRTFACCVTKALLHRLREKLTTTQIETNDSKDVSRRFFKTCWNSVFQRHSTDLLKICWLLMNSLTDVTSTAHMRIPAFCVIWDF